MSFKLLEIGMDALRRVRIGRAALVAATICVATAPSPSWAATNITENVTLDADTDWTEHGQVTIAAGVTLDLNGHALTVAAINGAGSIVDSAAAALAGYERLEYLEAKQTGASTGAPGGAQAQFIDTGYRHNAKTDVDIRMAYTAVNSYRVVYGARNTGNNDTQFGVWVNGGKFMRQTCQKSASTPSSGYAATVDTVYDIRISKSGANTVKLKDSATVLYDLADGNKTDGNNVTGNDYLFSMNQSNSSTTQGSWPCACKVWFCKISEEGVLKRNFVPVLRKSDNAKGMLDLVENKFYTKKTTESAAFEGPIAPHGLRLTPSGNGAASDFSGLTVGEGVVLAFTGQYALPANLDATKFASVEIADGATLDLNGHNLVTAGLTGGGIVTDNANPYYTTFTDASANAYIQLEYLASGTSIDNYNHGKEYIDTGYQHNTKTVVDMKVQILKGTTDWYCYYGARNGTANAFAGWIYRDNHYKGVTADGSTSTPYPKNVPYLAHMEFDGTCTFGNASDTSTYLTYTSGAGGSSGRNDFMFALNQGSGNQFGFNGRIYYCTVKEKTDEAGVYTIKRDFVAAKRLSDGVLGMLDKGNGVFYTNKGGGAFIAGDYTVNSEAAAFGSSGVLRIAVPAETTLALDDMPLIVGDVKILKEGAGVLTYNEATSTQKYFLGGYEDHSAPIIAVWTGAANNNDFNDAANWSCTNDLGSALSGVAPDATTIKYIFAADADWTAKGAIALGTGVTLDLNGNSLTATSITGAGIVTDTSTDNIIVADDGSIYQKIQYVQATQDGASNSAQNKIQYVDTEYYHIGTTKVDIRVEFQDVSYSGNHGYAVFYGCRDQNKYLTSQLGGWLHNSKFYYYDTSEHDGSTAYTGRIYDIRLDKGGSSYANYTDGTRASGLGTGNKAGESNTYGTDYIFANNQVPQGGKYWPCKCKVYSCKVYTGDTLERDFVPVRCISGAKAGQAGFWCDVTKKFYGNSGYGNLTAGPVVQSETPGGELHITVAENTTLSLGALTSIYGGIKVVKDGAGTMTLPADGQYFTGGFEVAGGTLPMTQTAAFLAGTPITATAGGTITIAASDGASYANDFTLAGGTLKVFASGTGNTTTASIAGTLALETGAGDAQPVVSIDMTDCTSATFQLNTTALNVGSGVTAAPGFVSLADTTAYEASIEGGTAIKVEHLTSPMTAVWTGLGEAGNFDDPGNWSCSNKYGVALANTTLPDNTTLTFRLGTDADWTAKGAIALGEGVTLDLNGRTLTAASITGDGVVTDTSADNVIVADDGSMYQKIKYVQATQDGASNSAQDKIQYVDTEYYHVGTTKVDIRVEFQDVSYSGNYGYAVFYGCRDQNNYKTAQLGGWFHSGKFYYYDTGEHDGAAAKTGVIYDIRLDKNGSSYANYEDGTLASTLGTGNGVGSSNTYGTDYIFANNQVPNGGKYWPCKCRVYSCKVYTGNTLERDFVPVRCIFGANAGKAGFWCNVTEKFYGNSGYGNLTAGPLVQGETSGGELHITVAEGATLSLANTAKIAGNVKIVKDGLGTLVAPTTGHYFVGGIDVTAGTLSMDGALAYGGTIDAAAGTTVFVPKSVGSAGTSVVNIAGGTLAVANCGTSVVTGTVTLGGNAISVAGSFAPVSGTAAHTITLADGATLDFTQWTGTFPVAYPTLSYASGANITLKLEPATTAITALARSKDAETMKPNGYLLSWDAPPSGVTFSPDAATDARFRVVPDENGLRVSFKAGLCIIIL